MEKQTGAAALLAQALVDLVGDSGPRVLLAGLFILTAVLGQVISITAMRVANLPGLLPREKPEPKKPEPKKEEKK